MRVPVTLTQARIAHLIIEIPASHASTHWVPAAGAEPRGRTRLAHRAPRDRPRPRGPWDGSPCPTIMIPTPSQTTTTGRAKGGRGPGPASRGGCEEVRTTLPHSARACPRPQGLSKPSKKFSHTPSGPGPRSCVPPGPVRPTQARDGQFATDPACPRGKGLLPNRCAGPRLPPALPRPLKIFSAASLPPNPGPSESPAVP